MAKVTPGSVRHWSACADVALWIERQWGPDAYISEREVRLAELLAEKPLYSAGVGRTDSEAPLLHRPDLVIVAGERPIAVEVELTAKAPRRLERIVRGWRRSRLVERVLYFAPAGQAFDAVERTIARTHAEDRVELVDLATARRP